MELEQAAPQMNADLEKKAKESGDDGGGGGGGGGGGNDVVSGNHSDHINGMSNGFDKKREHKSEHRAKDKERSHKLDHKDKDRGKDKEKNHKSEHKDKDKDRHRHSSSSMKDKEKHDSSSTKNKDKDKKSSSTKDKEHKSSSSSSKDKDKSKEHHHKSSSSSKNKDRYHNSSKDKDSKSKEKDKYRHSSSLNSSSRDKDRNTSKDKESKKHSSERDKDRHSISHSSGDKEKHRSSEKDKDKHRESSSSSKDKQHRHEKDKDRHRHDKDKSKHRDEKEKRDKDAEEIKIKEETDVKLNHVTNERFHYNEVKLEIKEEPMTQMELEDDDDSGGERPLYIKEEDDDEEAVKEDSMDSTDANDTRLSDLHNTTLKTEEGSEEDKPLSSRSKVSPSVKRKIESEEEDVPLSARKKPKKVTSSKIKKKKRKHDGEDDDSEAESEEKSKKKPAKAKGENTSPRKKKQEEKQEVWKWWEEEKKSDGRKWHFLEHKGPVFAPPYEPLPTSVKFYYNGKEMKLSQDTEEIATFYARMLDHDYTTKDVFNNNFFHDWREVMTESERAKITELSKCNFKEMHAYFMQKSEERKAMTKKEKQKIKETNEEIQKEYGFCIIDGHKEKIGNFKIEPPGLFRGRGEHPKMGKLKKRVIPEDVLINCSKDSNIPKPPVGHKWKEVRHDSNVTWLASWTENVQGQVKYVMLNPSSKLKGEKDWQKYETARKLAQSIDKIRAEYREDWKSKEMRIRQRAVALYFIDKLALRAGNEKDEDQADTVGCCSLRVEHIKLQEHGKDGKEYMVIFDFLGKDSIRYYNEVPVEKRVFKNLQLFMENKSPGDDLFDRLNTTVMNKHLNELMEGLTAKVFRTYNASWTLQQQLDKLTDPNDTEAEKILSYNRANRAVAILCNHQRSVPKTHAKSMENLKAKIDAKKEAIAECELQVKDAKRDAKHGSVKEKVIYEKKKKQFQRLKEQLTKLEVQATDREENKEIALSTSKLNYLDPRISVAWCKKHNVSIEKIYNKTQRDKFRWAIDMAGPDYVF